MTTATATLQLPLVDAVFVEAELAGHLTATSHIPVGSHCMQLQRFRTTRLSVHSRVTQLLAKELTEDAHFDRE